MLPDANTLTLSEAQRLCRFCLIPQIPGTMQPISTCWSSSEMGILYAQLTGGEQLTDTVVDADFAAVGSDFADAASGNCAECANRLRASVGTLQQFRAANAFWSDYLLVRQDCKPSDRTIKLEIDNTDDEDRIVADVSESANEVDNGNDTDDDHDIDDADRIERKYTTPGRTVRLRPIRPKTETFKPSLTSASRRKRIKRGCKTRPNSVPETPIVVPKKKRKVKGEGQVCHICGIKYQWRLRDHMKTAHTTFTCDICGSTLNHKIALRRHFRDVHGFQRYTCEVCNATNLTHSMWLRHADIHRPQAAYACDQCGNSYSTRHYLQRHVARVHVQQEVACPECGKRFQNAVRLTYHMIRHKPKELTCPVAGCPRMFWLRREMMEHVRTVHDKKRKYVCDICGKAFLMNAQLKKHHSLGRCPGGAGATTTDSKAKPAKANTTDRIPAATVHRLADGDPVFMNMDAGSADQSGQHQMDALQYQQSLSRQHHQHHLMHPLTASTALLAAMNEVNAVAGHSTGHATVQQMSMFLR